MASSNRNKGKKGQVGQIENLPADNAELVDYVHLSETLRVQGNEALLKSLGTPWKRLKIVESYWGAGVLLGKTLSEGTGLMQTRLLSGVYLERRKQAMANYLEEAVKRLNKEGVKAPIHFFLSQEMVPMNDYTVLDVEYKIRLAAAIWILEKLMKNGNLEPAQELLPLCPEGRGDCYMAFDFCYPGLDRKLIQSVIYAMDTRYPQNPEEIITEGNATNHRPGKTYQDLLGLLNPEDIDQACKTFKEKQWEIILKMLKVSAYNEREVDRILELMKYNPDPFRNQGAYDTNTLFSADKISQMVLTKKNFEPFQDIDYRNDREKVNLLCSKIIATFDHYLVMEKRALRRETNRELVEILSGFELEDPYEICFALLYLLDFGDDAPWLMGSGLILMKLARRLLPFYDSLPEMEAMNSESWDNYYVENWEQEIPYDRNEWYLKEAAKDDYDYLHEQHKGRTLAQIVYRMCHGVVPMGKHPFERDRKELIKEGMEEEKAKRLTDMAELFFLVSHHASTEFMEEDEDLLYEMEGWPFLFEGKSNPGQQAPSEAGEETEGEEGENEEPDVQEELKRLQEELEKAKKQIKGLTRALNSEKHSAKEEKARYDKEIKDLRMEHRELADLRTLVFNQENEVREVPKEKISYPYQTRKRTVVFGGHESFLKVIRTLLPSVRFVSPDRLDFQPEFVKNAEVVWIQTKYMSHAQYFRIVKFCKLSQVQVRYFAYSGAEYCANQLVEEDRK